MYDFLDGHCQYGMRGPGPPFEEQRRFANTYHRPAFIAQPAGTVEGRDNSDAYLNYLTVRTSEQPELIFYIIQEESF